jgi:hypothetical protein
MENLSDIEGMDVINVGLSAVLYDIHTQTYYNPNSGTTGSTSGSAGDVITDTEEKGGDAVNEADNQI